ncbi:MAG: hypothetical protein AMJ45_00650 [Syntrophobacter sp. DG_60]|nr:MAG: hypothetical protein AMJ45_00650 [Syntrophobacter sp. DG_60]
MSAVERLIEVFNKDQKLHITDLKCSALAYLLGQLNHILKRPIFAITPTVYEANELLMDLKFFLEPPETFASDKYVFLLSSEEFLPFEGLSPLPHTLSQQFSALFALLNLEHPLVVAPIRSLFSYFLPKSEFSKRIELCQEGGEIDRKKFIYTLHCLGYQGVNLVEGVGEFSVRGGIIDLSPPLYNRPLRLEFFGDKLESIRFFDPVSQRSKGTLSKFIIIPANPIPRNQQDFQKARENLTKLNILERPLTQYLEVPIHQPGIESLFPLFYDIPPSPIFDYLPKDTIICLWQPQKILDFGRKIENKFTNHLAESRHLPKELIYLDYSKIKHHLKQYRTLHVHELPVLNHKSLSFSLKTPFKGMDAEDVVKSFKSHIEAWLKQGFKVCLTCQDVFRQRNFEGLLKSYQMAPLLATPPFKKEKGELTIYRGKLSQGFVWPIEGMVIISESDFKIPSKDLTPSHRPALPVSTFEDLKEGDYIVHVEHGIGIYRSLVSLNIRGLNSEFLLIEYQNADKLYLPIDRLNLVQKYVGIEGESPNLDKLGARAFRSAKRRVKRAVEKIAKELLELYAKRMAQKGHVFSPLDKEYQAFEADFPYTETPDQQRAVNEVLADMMKSHPMDRLICGDVGFGKTEIAIRAAFKAILDAKQVAVLVPTTILAEQHYLTFEQRLENLPVNIACLNRFRPKKEQREILQGLRKGIIDIVIGTHRLLQKDIVFKDLGLAIIDEEHQFGVKQKEHLKKLKILVDVITLSATPIPRTLSFSLLGIRDLSLVETPPPDRLPVKTYLSRFSPLLIREAIIREIERGGQVFFVHPYVKGIPAIAKFLSKLIPGLRLGIAHGRLKERVLEETMIRFLKREIDVLLCTNIVGSGLDIPNVNTIIINRADMFGLPQLYHLRGRVGRSNRQAYAYLLVPHKKLVTSEAQKRLKALLEHVELSSGYKIALYDLKIRGAGNILGISQSGHIASVGYEMYLELLQKAIYELKGKPMSEGIEPEIKLPVSAYVPKDYIKHKDQRLVAYKRLSMIRDEEELIELIDEFRDRYGALPHPTDNLINLIKLKLSLRHFNVKRLDISNGALRFVFEKTVLLDTSHLIKFLGQHPDYRFTPEGELLVPLKRKGDLLDKAQAVVNALGEK